MVVRKLVSNFATLLSMDTCLIATNVLIHKGVVGVYVCVNATEKIEITKIN